jgi:hypothetical protein
VLREHFLHDPGRRCSTPRPAIPYRSRSVQRAALPRRHYLQLGDRHDPPQTAAPRCPGFSITGNWFFPWR